MNAIGKTNAVREWLRGCPEIGRYLRLNAVPLKSGEKTMATTYTDNVFQKFIDGTKERLYIFSVVLIADWSAGFDSVNAEAQEFGSRLMDWIDSQFPENVPDFGPNCEIRKIETLQNVPSLTQTYQQEMLAKYDFQAQITYWEHD